ncbi:hypothetical protein [Sphaerospermopsis aphanizomenoides]|uniref:hypothetical protein n=1 Tax=Sphaerospermopsis aphanizomenoides TaxID=459663 RepID=UPI00398ADBF5
MYKEKQLLKDDYDANKFLAYCLNYASREVCYYIENTLLLTIEEIKKRPFNP